MDVLIIGAAGHVGSILRPALEQAHACRYLDLRPVEGAEDRTHVGSVTDAEAVEAAMAGADACIQLAMSPVHGRDPRAVDLAYDVHVKGMHVVCRAAATQGCKRVIYASTMSVYQRSIPNSPELDETDPPNATNLYGLTKRLGEEVCRAFAINHPELSILAYRMVLPCTEEQWAQGGRSKRPEKYQTGPDDLRRAYLAGLALEGHQGFDAFTICSDVEGRFVNLNKAKRVLGWEPRGE